MSRKSDIDLSSEPETHVIKGLQQKKVFKIIVLGDSNVGKTCLTFRFCEGHFLQQCEATIGVDFRERTVRIRNEDVKLQLWDTAGQERFRKSMVQHYYRNVNAVVIVYDVTKISSFKSISTWINEVDTHGLHDAPRVLVGNKCDCPENERAVNTTVAQRFADQYGMPLFETSARLDSECDNVESIFMTLAHKLHSRLPLRVASVEGETLPNSPSTLRLQHKQTNNELTLRNIQDGCSCN